MDDERNETLPDQQEQQLDNGNETYKDISTDELKDLFTQLKQQTTELVTELKARHAAPEGVEDDAPDWEAQFNTYRAPFESGKE